MPRDVATLSISDLAARTGVGVAQLRAWEARHGFPQPERLANGHRRYRSSDAEAVTAVLRHRRAGLSLEAAIARVGTAPTPAPGSIYATLRLERDDLPVHRLSRRTMAAVSHAIEDGCLAAGDRPVIVGAFQAERFYRANEARWRELARTASGAVVFADFDATPSRSDTTEAAGHPVEVALPPHAALGREWLVACDGPRFAAVVAGWEIPPAGGTYDGRMFEATWSAERVVAARAVEIALALARDLAPGAPLPAPPGPAPDDPDDVVRRATSLTNRIVARLEPPPSSRA